MKIYINTEVLSSEAKLLLNLTLSTLVLHVGSMFSSVLISSQVGTQLGKVALGGSTLANVIGNLTCISVLSGIISASDTLSPQAFGRGKQREVGLIAIRAFFAALLVIAPIQLCVYYLGGMRFIFSVLGENQTSIDLAMQWYSIYLCAIPFHVLYLVIWRFLVAQEIMAPLTWTTTVSAFVFMPISLTYFLTSMGFIGSALAFFSYQVVLVFGLFAYLAIAKPYHVQTWPGFSVWREALEWSSFYSYLKLGVGGILSSTVWIYWESFSLIAGSLGLIALNVHAIAANVVMIAIQVPFGIGAALNVRLGATLPNNVPRAKALVVGCYLITALFMGSFCMSMYAIRFHIFKSFTNDEIVIQECEKMWKMACLNFFFMSFFAMNICVMQGLGLQWTSGSIMVVFLWFISLPIIYYYAIANEGGIKTMWTGFCISYALLDLILFYFFASRDWYRISQEINHRQMSDNDENIIKQNSKGYGSTETTVLV